mgnify:CR=1 FL=1
MWIYILKCSDAQFGSCRAQKKFVHPKAGVHSNSHQSRKGAPVRNGILIYIFTYPALP